MCLWRRCEPVLRIPPQHTDRHEADNDESFIAFAAPRMRAINIGRDRNGLRKKGRERIMTMSVEG